MNGHGTGTHSPIHRFRMNGKLKQDADRAARKTVGGLSGLIREGLALRLYGRLAVTRGGRAIPAGLAPVARSTPAPVRDAG